MPDVILWSPCEQFSRLSFWCPKCSKVMQTPLSPTDWTYSPSRQPRLIHRINTNILLISRVYQCSTGHVVLGHPDIKYAKVEWSPAFHLASNWIFNFIGATHWAVHGCRSITPGMWVYDSSQQTSMIVLSEKKYADVSLYQTEMLSTLSSTNVDEVVGISVLKQAPSRNAALRP